MTEAMSSAEIEDVLTSIRRLVSEDLRPTPKMPAPAEVDQKLILTPALRIVAVSDGAPRPAQFDPPAPLSRLHLGVVTSPDEMVFRLGHAAAAEDAEWESEVGDAQPQVAQMEWTEDGWAAVDAKADDAIADGAETGSPAAAEVSAEPDASVNRDVPAWAQTGPDMDPGPGDVGPAQVEDADPAIGADLHWADQAEVEVLAGLRDSDEAAASAPLDDEMVYDEQVLRDLVRDLIREELQGVLGERITRNVRKLVHAEIARALAAQDLE